MSHGDTTSQPRNCSTVKADSLTVIIQHSVLYNSAGGPTGPPVDSLFSLSFFFFGRHLICKTM